MIEKAAKWCGEFYGRKEGDKDKTAVKYLGNGAESVVYKCESEEEIEPSPTGLIWSSKRCGRYGHLFIK